MVRRSSDAPQQSTGFAIGEEAEQSGTAVIREVGSDSQRPSIRARCKARTGQKSARVDVVVRTRKIGHFFPGGTVDAFDVWLGVAGL